MTMRAVFFNGASKPLTVEKVNVPRPAANEVLLKISRCGICGSDISMTSGGPFDYKAGRQLGHEYAGEVVESGADVTGLKVGDRVVCLPNGFCGKCEPCRMGRPLFCSRGKPLSGGMADFIAVPASSLIILPDGLSSADGALVEPIACGRHALRSARFEKGSRLLVLGAGSMALSAIFWGRALGAAEITVLSRSAHRRDVVMGFGADRYLCHEDDDPGHIAQLETQPYEFVAECAGRADMVSSALKYLRPAGTVISMGMCMCNETYMPAALAFKEANLRFPLGYSFDDFEQTVRAFEANEISPDSMVSDTIAIEDVPAMFDKLRSGAKSLKVLIDPEAIPAAGNGI